MTINLTFWLILALSMSIIANILAFWYIRVVLGKLMFVGENIADLVDVVDNYKKHLKSIYEMDMFYGDETLKFLMEHTNSLMEVLGEYDDINVIINPPETEEEQLIEQEEIIENAETKINQENVFYAGTRTSNN